MRDLRLDPSEFESRSSEEYVRLVQADRDQFAEREEFLRAVNANFGGAALVDAGQAAAHPRFEHITALLKRGAPLFVPISPAATIVPVRDEWDHWEGLIEDSKLFTWISWTTTA